MASTSIELDLATFYELAWEHCPLEVCFAAALAVKHGARLNESGPEIVALIHVDVPPAVESALDNAGFAIDENSMTRYAEWVRPPGTTVTCKGEQIDEVE